MNLKRLVSSDFGVKMLSIILGLGLATLFRKVCKGRNCMVFKGPSMKEVEKTTYKKNDKCYQFNYENVKCDTKKSIIEFSDEDKNIDYDTGKLF
tara:strand:+ start:202 stop:483 length:282 start_codon:yes stop_codon:yes gene_type:complete